MRWHCCAAFGSRARKLIWRRAFMALGSAIGSVRHADGKALSEAPVEDLLCCIRCRASHCCVALIWSRVKPEKFAKLVQREVLWAQIEGVAKGNVIELCCAVKETFELAAQMGLDQRKRFRYGRRRARADRLRGGDARKAAHEAVVRGLGDVPTPRRRKHTKKGRQEMEGGLEQCRDTR